MDKNAIKKYAVWARRELISRVSQKALQYGITEENTVPVNSTNVNGVILSNDEIKQRRALIERITDKGYQQVMEEVAYTWFNRFIALRFMEVNGYLPSHVRVFTDDENNFKPQILTEAINLDFNGLNMDKVYELKEANDNEALFKYLIIAQCNELHSCLPRMFQEISDYTELLFPDNLLREGSVIDRLINDISGEAWTEQVEILGWLYQYYISDKHDEIINIYKGTVKKEDIPAATQLFTTDWVVRYMVDNSLGRYWIERHPESNLADKLEFFVKPKNGEIVHIKENVSPQEMTFFDPCMGSGHILVYAFDVLMEIYRECGYTDREAVIEIIQNNLYGLDIDDRCSQLAYFAVMMKARSYDRRFLTRGLKPHVLSIKESNKLDTFTHKSFMPDRMQNEIGEYLIELFRHAKEIGSLKVAKEEDYERFQVYLETRVDGEVLDIELALWQAEEMPLMIQLAEQAKILSKKYAIVCTNPPYLGKLEGKLKDFVLKEFKPYSGDLFSVFVYNNFAFCKKNGYSGFMTPFVWMFIQTYQNLREYIINHKWLTSLIQMEYSAFEEATVPICSFVLKNGKDNSSALCIRLSDFKGGMEVQKNKVLEAIENPNCGWFFETNPYNFTKIPGSPIAYWVSEIIFNVFLTNKINSVAFSDGQILTGDNNKYLRMLWEVDATQIKKDGNWMLHAKGGEYRKWSGNLEWIVKWSPDAIQHYKSDRIARFPKNHILFRKGVTWSLVSTNPTFGARLLRETETFNKAAATVLFSDEKYINYTLALVNSAVINYLAKIINPTLNNNIKDILAMPFIYDEANADKINCLAQSNIDIAESDWDAFETSWSFKVHPLVETRISDAYAGGDNVPTMYLSAAYSAWEQVCQGRFDELKANEEELNRIFIDIYGLQDELTADVEDKDVTVRLADKKRDIKSLLSYAVGCMFGRYSLDYPGLVHAGGEWDDSKYITFIADKDSIIPISDDEYFEDDIVNRFVHFIEIVYGKQSLEENLQFIAEALGGSGQPRDVIRKYFMNEFFADHCKVYQKRPIYWLFDSGKKNGFKALVYMHRYQPDTIARMRTDYVHEQQSRYRTAIADLEQRIASATTSERVKLNKKLKTLKDQAAEIQVYEEKIHHLADQYISIDLDDGVKVNYAKFQDVLAKIK